VVTGTTAVATQGVTAVTNVVVSSTVDGVDFSVSVIEQAGVTIYKVVPRIPEGASGALAGALVQAISDVQRTLPLGARIGRIVIAGAAGYVAVQVGVAAGIACEAITAVETAGGSTPGCIAVGIGAGYVADIYTSGAADWAESQLGLTAAVGRTTARRLTSSSASGTEAGLACPPTG
jgi:hypothetical protein